jgi:hypothetical protein
MGLSLKRNVGQQIVLQLVEGTTAEELIAQLRDGITITLASKQATGVRLNIEAPDCLNIYRKDEPAEGEPAGPGFDLTYASA